MIKLLSGLADDSTRARADGTSESRLSSLDDNTKLNLIKLVSNLVDDSTRARAGGTAETRISIMDDPTKLKLISLVSNLVDDLIRTKAAGTVDSRLSTPDEAKMNMKMRELVRNLYSELVNQKTLEAGDGNRMSNVDRDTRDRMIKKLKEYSDALENIKISETIGEGTQNLSPVVKTTIRDTHLNLAERVTDYQIKVSDNYNLMSYPLRYTIREKLYYFFLERIPDLGIPARLHTRTRMKQPRGGGVILHETATGLRLLKNPTTGKYVKKSKQNVANEKKPGTTSPAVDFDLSTLSDLGIHDTEKLLKALGIHSQFKMSLKRAARYAIAHPFKTAGMVVKKTLGAVIEYGIQPATDMMDIYGVLSTFSDAMYFDPTQLADADFIQPSTLNNFAGKAIQKQLLTISDSNRDFIDAYNSISTNATQSDYPRPRIRFPIIIGPFQWPSDPSDNQYADDPYYIDFRQQTMIEQYMEARLRFPSGSGGQTYDYKASLRAAMGIDSYDSVFSDSADLLTSYITGSDAYTFAGPTGSGSGYDDLYREAFTYLCTQLSGTTYTDVWPTDSYGSQGSLGGRPRLQCGWSDKTTCNNRAKMWYEQFQSQGYGPGPYAEWFNWTDPALNTLRNGIDIDPAIKTGTVGACIATTYGGRSLSEWGTGSTYDIDSHSPTYSEEFCKSQGACYDRTNHACYLVPDTMEALSAFFGTGGPREWIKVNGCNYMNSDPTKNFEDFLNSTGFGMIFTQSGQKMLGDALANSKNWNAGFRSVLVDPVYTVNFVSSILGVYTLFRPSGFMIGVTLLLDVTAGIMAGIDAVKQNVANKTAPIPDAQEYSVGGLKVDTKGNNNPIYVSYEEGWVTKPIKLHPFDDIAHPYSHASDYAEMTTTKFFPAMDEDFWDNGNYYAGFLTNDLTQGKCWTKNPPMIRAGSDAYHNTIWCLPQKPSVRFADTTNIGELTTTSSSFRVNRAWTGGVDPDYPDYPMVDDTRGAMWVGADTTNPWYYQLSYDKTKMVGMSNGKGFPTKLWDDTYLRKYFTDATIGEMRRHYCITELSHSDAVLPVQCYGFINARYTTTSGHMTYRFFPMTIRLT